ncbi:armadillo-like helical domain-containing protein 3 [Ischnura elegans]|uniref:armadillo-like helical domain-containing protein 3 n=1 Tax=Ischnura elegans TaxID=197161 RepID=UPI001ED8BB33|nr:armadillo-like helical domain-containing protein 3 [Ischnura elegans]XP_046386240.1 armadillo-like helical domain-containing protein 3 [Ischnura elegans]
MSSRKRSGSGSKRQLKEKIVQIYESIFRGEDPSLGNPNFWDEFFLLKPKVSHLEGEIQKLNGEQLISLKENINTLFAQCVTRLGDEHSLRVVYALQTLCTIIQGIYKKTLGECGFDVINILMGFDIAEQLMEELLDHVNTFLTGVYPASLKGLCLKLLLVLLTGSENVSQNTLLEYVMINSVFESLMQLLCDPALRTALGHDAVLALTLLVNYRKHEAANPYVVKLSIWDDELALNGYGQVIATSLAEFCRQFTVQRAEPQSGGGWLSSLTSMVGNMFVSDEAGARTQQIRANNAVLLALYEGVHLNRNFITTLTHSRADTGLPPLGGASASGASTIQPPPTSSSSPTLYLSSISSPVGDAATAPTHNPMQASVQTPSIHNASSGVNNHHMSSQPDASSAPSGPIPHSASLILASPSHSSSPMDVNLMPANLLVTFFEYCSIVMQDTKCEASANNAKLCFLVLTCIAEDQYANSLMHDANLAFRVTLHRLPMRHRRAPPPDRAASPCQPLACALLDLLVEFIMSHMLKRLPMELLLWCLGVGHRLICYQKRSRVRLAGYQWGKLWAAVIALLQFLNANESHLARKMNIFQLALQVVNIFNLFITYGDTFLPSPASYDDLYYELIRCHEVFENVYSMALRYSTQDGEYKESALKLANSLVNVRAIINHFSPKIGAWLLNQGLSTPTEDQILEVVRSNYDSLTLKLQDSLDQYERYSEKPRHSAFFTAMVRNVVNDTRQNIDFASLDLQKILQECSSIS